jgi:hypothetical protein
MRPACMIALLMIGTIASATLAAPKELNIVLKWNPNEKQAMPALDITGGVYAVAIAPSIDKRDKGNQIGENTEGKVAVPVNTSSDVPAFVREHLVAQIKSIGLDVKAADAGDRVLHSELVECWVAESKRYNGSVRLRVSIADASGKELWSALVGGTSDNFGRSLKPDNYTESISNSIEALAANLVSAAGFRAAIAKTR